MQMRWIPLCLLAAHCPAAEPLPGHSQHGEAFNEGPRREAVLMGNTGDIQFPVTTTKSAAQLFFNQGIGQLHGFWYFEAERSFRQVAKLDPECAMAYWGMAMANINNEARARAFINKAHSLKDKTASRDQHWIEALHQYYQEPADKDKPRDKKQREQDLITALDNIVQTHPQDPEARAFLAWKIWHAKSSLPITSPTAVNTLLDSVFALNPNHPAHHYRIHLWDGFKPEQALGSAAACGQVATGIAHMWHMPGHIYSKLKRFDDAAWQQEASTRVDHQYMMDHLILPDQIHNYAHNEEWLVRTFNELGRAREAIALATSLIANPRHPDLNTLDKGNKSASYGRTRLLETLQKWQLWDQLLATAKSPHFEPTQNISHQVSHLKALGIAHFAKNNPRALQQIIRQLTEIDQQEAQKQSAKEKAESTKNAPKDNAPKKTESQSTTQKPAPKGSPPKDTATPSPKEKPKARPSETALLELKALRAALTAHQKADTMLEAASATLDKTLAAQAWLLIGHPAKALALSQSLPQDLAGSVTKAKNLLTLGRLAQARTAFDQAYKAAFSMDEDLPAARDLRTLARYFDVKTWHGPHPRRTDTGIRPTLSSLGPMHWQPPHAPQWQAITPDNQLITNGTHPGKPQLLIFYLGAACTHCVEQLNAIDAQHRAFRDLGIHIQAISPQVPHAAAKANSLTTTGKPFQFPLLSDPSLAAFHQFGAHDDFEQEPLHATILLDAEHRIRWIDVSYQPFMNIDFLLQESQRLLSLPTAQESQ